MDIEMIWHVAFIIGAVIFLIAMATIMTLYRLSDEYKRRHRDKYFYDYSQDKWVRRKKRK